MDTETRLQCLEMAVRIGGNADTVLANAEAFRLFAMGTSDEARAVRGSTGTNVIQQ